jgi:hypothetical protein
VESAAPFYAVGLLVILAGASTTGVHGLRALGVLVIGLAIFVLGIVIEERVGS